MKLFILFTLSTFFSAVTMMFAIFASEKNIYNEKTFLYSTNLPGCIHLMS